MTHKVHVDFAVDVVPRGIKRRNGGKDGQGGKGGKVKHCLLHQQNHPKPTTNTADGPERSSAVG